MSFVKVVSSDMAMIPTDEDRASKREKPDQLGGTFFVPGLVVGWLIVMAWAGTEVPREPAQAEMERERFTLESDPSRWNARELRILPGIGERRALSAVLARKEHLASPRAGEPLPWETVPGIGQLTGTLVRADLERRGVRQMELWGGR